MIQILWALLWGISLVAAFVHGQMAEFALKMSTVGKEAIQMMLALAGALLFWTGVLRVAEASGLIRVFSKILSPLLRLIFPGVPRNHPAMGWIASNVSANLLGIGNAATPLGLQAMKSLQTLNPHPHRPTAAMHTFVILNTAGVTLLPTTVIALRGTMGSVDPTWIVWPSLIVTGSACLITLLLDRFWKISTRQT